MPVTLKDVHTWRPGLPRGKPSTHGASWAPKSSWGRSAGCVKLFVRGSRACSLIRTLSIGMIFEFLHCPQCRETILVSLQAKIMKCTNMFDNYTPACIAILFCVEGFVADLVAPNNLALYDGNILLCCFLLFLRLCCCICCWSIISKTASKVCKAQFS